MTPKSESVWVLGGIKKTILRKKPENSNPLIIYNTLSMSTPPKTPPFWSPNSAKIKEKWTLKTNLKKTLKLRPSYLFLQFWLPKWVTQGGVEQVPFSTCFRVLGRFGHPWGPPLPKMVPRASLREPKVTSGGYFLKLFGVDFLWFWEGFEIVFWWFLMRCALFSMLHKIEKCRWLVRARWRGGRRPVDYLSHT